MSYMTKQVQQKAVIPKAVRIQAAVPKVLQIVQ